VKTYLQEKEQLLKVQVNVEYYAGRQNMRDGGEHHAGNSERLRGVSLPEVLLNSKEAEGVDSEVQEVFGGRIRRVLKAVRQV
jgi:hypothetical protein